MDKTEEISDQFSESPLGRTPNIEKTTIDISGLKDRGEELPPGYILGRRYKIIQSIGKGGMGRVYKVYDLTLKTFVSLKIMRSDYFMNRRFIQKFKNEILLARQISHPNIVKIYDMDHVDDFLFITMQYIEGKNLKEYLRETGTLQTAQIRHIADQILQGLKAAHNANIIHNDLKPRNIIVDHQDRVYIADFGLSTLVRKDGVHSVNENSFVGTPNYIAPEIWKNHRYSYRADLYAFGVLLYEMIYSRPPFDADTVYGVITKHLQEVPVFPRHPRTPAYMKQIIRSCLVKDPQKRIADPDAIIKILQKGRRGGLQFLWKRRWIAISLLVPAGLMAGFLLVPPRVQSGPPLFHPRKTVALYPLSGGENPPDKTGDWGKVLTSLLKIDLSQSLHLDIRLNPDLTELKSRVNPSRLYVIRGDFSMKNDNFRVNIGIFDSQTRDLFYTVSESGMGKESVYHIVDSLSGKIKDHLQLTPKQLTSDIDERLSQVTSRNPQALVYYVNAREYFQKNRYQMAIGLLQKALKLDPGFASAHLLIAEAYELDREFLKMRQHLEQALTHSRHTTLKERLYIKACYHDKVNQDRNQAIEIFKRLLKLYPDQPEMLRYLGGMYRLNEEWHKALLTFRRLPDPPSFQTVNNIFYILLARQRLQEADNYLLENRELIPESSLFHRYRAYVDIQDNRLVDGMAEIEQSLRENPSDLASQVLRGQVCYLMNRPGPARRTFCDISARDPQPYYVSESHFMLASICLSSTDHRQYPVLLDRCEEYLLQHQMTEPRLSILTYRARYLLEHNQVSAAISILKKALQEADQINSHYHKLTIYLYLGMARVKKGEISQVQRIITRMEEMIRDKQGIKKLRYSYLLKGYVSRAQGTVQEAISQFRMAESLLSRGYGFRDTALFYRALADAYFDDGQTAEALKYYLKIRRENFGRIHLGDIYRHALERIATIYEDRGWKGKALEYRKMLRQLDIKGDRGATPQAPSLRITGWEALHLTQFH